MSLVDGSYLPLGTLMLLLCPVPGRYTPPGETSDRTMLAADGAIAIARGLSGSPRRILVLLPTTALLSHHHKRSFPPILPLCGLKGAAGLPWPTIVIHVGPRSPPTLGAKKVALKLQITPDRYSLPLSIGSRNAATQYLNKHEPPHTLPPKEPAVVRVGRNWHAENDAADPPRAGFHAAQTLPAPPAHSAH